MGMVFPLNKDRTFRNQLAKTQPCQEEKGLEKSDTRRVDRGNEESWAYHT